MTRTRTEAACLADAMQPFDWDAHNRNLDRLMAEFEAFRERDAERGCQMIRATEDMARAVQEALDSIA